MYRAKLSGSIGDSNGKIYRFDRGTLVDAPKGTFDEVKDLEWIDSEVAEPKKEPVQKTGRRKRK